MKRPKKRRAIEERAFHLYQTQNRDEVLASIMSNIGAGKPSGKYISAWLLCRILAHIEISNEEL